MTMHRDLPEAVEELRGRVDRLESMFPKSVSASSPVAQENKGGDMGGLRTERVTLEVTTTVDRRPASEWYWGALLTHCDESVRVVPEAEAGVLKGEVESWKILALLANEKRDALAARVAAMQTERDDALEQVAELERMALTAEQKAAAEPVAYYTAPLPAAGWLTGEEREAVEWLSQLDKPLYLDVTRKHGRVAQALLTRNAPPKVVLPERGIVVIDDDRDAEWIAALAAAGVECQQ